MTSPPTRLSRPGLEPVLSSEQLVTAALKSMHAQDAREACCHRDGRRNAIVLVPFSAAMAPLSPAEACHEEAAVAPRLSMAAETRMEVKHISASANYKRIREGNIQIDYDIIHIHTV